MGKQSAPRREAENEASATLRMVRSSPRKLNDVARLIRGLKVNDAIAQLTFCQRRIAGPVKQTLQSAIANAENNHSLDVDNLYVSEATVGKALVMKRFRARARGRAAGIKKPFSNITIVVKEQSGDE